MNSNRPRVLRMLSDEATTDPGLAAAHRPDPAPQDQAQAPGEEFRELLISVTTCLSLYAGIQTSRRVAGAPEWWPWERVSKVLYEALSDLQNPVPMGERLVGRAALLSLISDGLDLVTIDRDFYFLLSVYMQACVLVNLMNGECPASDREVVQQRAFRDRIRSSLEFVTVELAELGRRYSQSAA